MGSGYLKFKCPSCHKKLGEFEGKIDPGEVKFDISSGLTYSTGVRYCDKCYSEMYGSDLNKKVNGGGE